MMRLVIALVPSIGVLAIFWIAIRAMVQADRRERIAQARIELAQRGRSPAAPDAARAPGRLGQMGESAPGPNRPAPESPEESSDE
jgi:hypothetical protein